MKMTERGQVTIPKPIRDQFGFSPDIEVEILVKHGMVVVEPKPDMDQFDAAVKKWLGSGRKRMKQLGFDSSEEFSQAIRGRK